jgi:Type II CAAX prenyl endopeptidase Rce1-like
MDDKLEPSTQPDSAVAQPTIRPGKVRVDIYQLETLRPFVCLIFVAPFLVIYEMGVIFSGNEAVRNGVDVGLQWLLGAMGIGHLLLLPILTVVLLMTMHHARNDRFGFHPSTLTGMMLESMGLGLILLFAAKGHQLWFREFSGDSFVSIQSAIEFGSARMTDWERVVSFCGAGLYEELVFRLVLLSGFVWGMRRLGIRHLHAAIASVVLTSLLFAAAHYDLINPAGSAFELSTFAVRMVASLFFCVVFLLRGFGIAVGTHIAYDIFAQVV